ncbi:Catabolite repression protein creC, partial [Zancudomyces culisetae]
VKAGFTDEKSKKATEKNDSSADSKAEEKSSKEKDSARGIVTRAKSSFVQRIVQASNIGNWLTAADQQTVFIFLNASRTFLWSGTRSDHEGDQQLLSRMDLSYNTPTCHDVNPLTRTTSKLELVLGFETGDLLCYDALQCKYERMNKARENDWPITKVKWIPGSETRFVAATKDGYLMTLDRAKGTWNFPKISSDPTQHGGCTSNRTSIPDFFQCLTEPNRQSNPINLFHISNEAITDVSFSPDCQHVALVGEDGYLRIFDYVQNKLRDVFQSYFGGFTCVCWSGDGRYILTGGKDDLVSVWSFHDRTLVARCQGHKSWVRGVAFDNFMYANEGEYRFGSVGEDNMLLFWDFSMRSLIRPQNLVSNTFFNNSNESTLSTKGVKLSVYSPNLTSSTNICNTTNNVGTGNESDKNNSNNNDSNTTSLETIIHPLASRDEVSTLFPVVSVAAHGAPICNIQFSKSWVATACKHGIIKIWKRP